MDRTAKDDSPPAAVRPNLDLSQPDDEERRVNFKSTYFFEQRAGLAGLDRNTN